MAARELEHAEVAALPIEDPAEAAVHALESGMLVERDRRIGFRHALLREAVYSELPQPRRAALHESWAQTLLSCASEGGPGRAAEVARHLRLAGRDRQAVEQLALAAADARAVGALTEAAGYLQEAVSMAGDSAELWLELAEVQAWRGLRAEAEAAFAPAATCWRERRSSSRGHGCAARAGITDRSACRRWSVSAVARRWRCSIGGHGDGERAA